jgi:hypothetical protein
MLVVLLAVVAFLAAGIGVLATRTKKKTPKKE